MKLNKTIILALLIALSVLVGPVSADQYDVDASMTNDEIQDIITNDAESGDTINFEAGNYNGIHLTIGKKLNLLGNGATLNGDGTSILNIANTNGVEISDFNININNDTADGITGSNVYNCAISNNNITNGDDGINIYMLYENLTITNNRITYVDRDGISLVNHATTINMTTFIPSTIAENVIENVVYGIFLGGNFKGDIIGNTIAGTTAGLTITGKSAATNGKLNATIANNTIAGIAMECPNVLYLNLTGNTIGQLGTTNNSIVTNAYFDGGSHDYISVTFNDLVYQVYQAFKDATDYAANNTGVGAYTKP
jgi:hypothetical protein